MAHLPACPQWQAAGHPGTSPPCPPCPPWQPSPTWSAHLQVSRLNTNMALKLLEPKLGITYSTRAASHTAGEGSRYSYVIYDVSYLRPFLWCSNVEFLHCMDVVGGSQVTHTGWIGRLSALGRSLLHQRLNLPSAAPSNTYPGKLKLKLSS